MTVTDLIKTLQLIPNPDETPVVIVVPSEENPLDFDVAHQSVIDGDDAILRLYPWMED